MSFQGEPCVNPTKLVLSKPRKRQFKRSLQIRFNQFRYRKSNNAPYISGDSIAALTDYYVFGMNGDQRVDLKKLSNVRSIFLDAHRLEDFFTASENCELKDITLVTGNSDRNFEIPVELPKGIRFWLCQNNGIAPRDNIRTLPIGIENLRLGRLGLSKWYSPRFSNAVTDLVLVPPMSPTNRARYSALDHARKRPEMFSVRSEYLVERDYFNLTRGFRFVLCCEGNGFENHRIWETLYQGSFPVMIRSRWSSSLEYLKLPILFVDSLEEVNKSLLSDFIGNHTNFNPNECPQLWTPFWSALIRSQGATLELS